MKLTLERSIFTNESTIGQLFIDGKFECYTLEDKDRGLCDSMSTLTINEIKQYGVTCIPYGKYQVKITYSNHFKRELPLLLNVKGYEGIRIHPGNTANDTLGCILPGNKIALNQIIKGTSKPAFDSLFAKIKACKEDIFIEIIKHK